MVKICTTVFLQQLTVYPIALALGGTTLSQILHHSDELPSLTTVRHFPTATRSLSTVYSLRSGGMQYSRLRALC